MAYIPKINIWDGAAWVPWIPMATGEGAPGPGQIYECIYSVDGLSWTYL